MKVSKRDWKLYREKLPEWQEAYMERFEMICGVIYGQLFFDWAKINGLNF